MSNLNNENIFKISTIINFGIVVSLVLKKIFEKRKDNNKFDEFKISKNYNEFNLSKNDKKESYKFNKSENSKIFDFPKEINKFNKDNENKKKIYKICLTGGPCGGKTTGIALLSKKFRELGYNVITLPDVVSLIVHAGGCIYLNDKPRNYIINRQTEILKMTMNIENYFSELVLSRNDKSTIILCDRGTLDGGVYINPDIWKAILDENNYNEIQLSHNRYDGIIHLVSAADGKTKFFNFINPSNKEIEINWAKELDQKLQNIYACHPKHIIIKNFPNKTFEDKINWLFEEVSGLINCNIDTKFSGNIKKSIYILKKRVDIKELSYSYVDIEKNVLNTIHTYKDHKIISSKNRILSKHTIDGISSYYLNSYVSNDNNLDNPENHHVIKNSRKINPKEYILYKKETSKNNYSILFKRKIFIINKKLYNEDEIFNLETGDKMFLILKKINMKDYCCDDMGHLDDNLLDFISKIVEAEDKNNFNIRNLSKKN